MSNKCFAGHEIKWDMPCRKCGATSKEACPERNDELAQLRAERDRLREALRFYADPKSYELICMGEGIGFINDTPVMEDGGSTAREALAECGE